jgi:hypothetical protein
LKFLHPEESLSKPKLRLIEQLTTEHIVTTLAPGQIACLKVRPDGTILDGHHRIYVLKTRGVDVNGLPREVVTKTDEN